MEIKIKQTTENRNKNVMINNLQSENGKLRRVIFDLEKQIKNLQKEVADKRVGQIEAIVHPKSPRKKLDPVQAYFVTMAKQRRMYTSKAWKNQL